MNPYWDSNMVECAWKKSMMLRASCVNRWREKCPVQCGVVEKPKPIKKSVASSQRNIVVLKGTIYRAVIGNISVAIGTATEMKKEVAYKIATSIANDIKAGLPVNVTASRKKHGFKEYQVSRNSVYIATNIARVTYKNGNIVTVVCAQVKGKNIFRTIGDGEMPLEQAILVRDKILDDCRNATLKDTTKYVPRNTGAISYPPKTDNKDIYYVDKNLILVYNHRAQPSLMLKTTINGKRVQYKIGSTDMPIDVAISLKDKILNDIKNGTFTCIDNYRN